MKNINKWDSLSIKDKADLMKLYIKNGINNLEDIRSHYNKFATGGNTEEEENTVPTKEEYITQRLEEARLKALEKSRTRTMPKSPIILNEESEEEYNAKRELFTENISRLQEVLKELETQKTSGFFVDKQIEHTKKKITTYQDWLSKPYEKYKKGASCLYTATDNYGKEYLVSGNKSFASNPQKYGFKKIEKTYIQPGDLVQDVSLGYPNHAMIYNGKNESGLDTFNYSRGGDSEGDIVKGGIYKQNVPLDVFRFVGTAKDSTQYINDYNKLYGNKFQDGGNKVLKSNKPIYNNWQEVINDSWYKNIQDNTYIGTIPYKSMYQNKDATTKLPKNTTIDNFINVMYPIVEQSMISKGKSLKNVDNMVKQIAYESNYGRSSRGNGYNLAGIKEFDSSKPRTKYKDGQYYKDFNDYRDFADYYVDLVTNRYEVENAGNLRDYVDRLHGKNSSGKSYSTNRKYYRDMKNMKTLDKKIKNYKK